MTPSTRLFVRSALAVMAARCVTASLPAFDFPEHIADIEIKPGVMWQEMPDEVKSAFVGPDDRVWIQLEYPARPEEPDKAKEIIRREFRAATPQLFSVRPALFEPGGRVWFVGESSSRLFGYDGTNMIEHEMPARQYLPGNCPNHGRVYRTGCNLFADGQPFFLASHGVLRFKDAQWHYERFLPDDNSGGVISSRMLLGEPDGKGAVALLRDETSTVIRRWRDGSWRPVDTAQTATANVTGVAPRDDGVWLSIGKPSNGILFVSYDSAPATAGFDGLLRNLGANEFAVRESATLEIKKMRSAVLPLARRALADSDDPEVTERLKDVIAAVSSGTVNPSSFGPYVLEDAAIEFCDAFGAMYVSSSGIRFQGRYLGPGLVCQNSTGTFSFVASEDFATGWRSVHSEDSGPLVVPGRGSIWRPCIGSGNCARLFDVAERSIASGAPSFGYNWLHAVRKDGSVFVGQREPTQGARPIALFNPLAPDNCLRLSGVSVEVMAGQPAVTGDGVAFAFLREQGLARFCGKAWEPIAGIPPGASGWPLSAGRSGILIEGAPAFLVDRDGNVTSAKTTADLLAGNKDLVAGILGASARNVVTDAGSNIWHRAATTRVEVHTGNTWLWLDDLLKAAGSRTGTASLLVAASGGNTVYISDLMSVHSGGRSFFGRVVDGKPVFSPAPHTCEDWEAARNIHDTEGALWIPGSIRGGGGTCDWISGQVAHRVLPDGTISDYTNAGWAVLCDARGNVWLGSIRGERQDRFNIWRNGLTTNLVAIPGATGYSELMSDRPGSVFAWTGAALRRLMSSAPDRADFRHRSTYYVGGIDGDVLRFMHSPLGFFVVHWRKTQPERTFVTIVPVPK